MRCAIALQRNLSAICRNNIVHEMNPCSAAVTTILNYDFCSRFHVCVSLVLERLQCCRGYRQGWLSVVGSPSNLPHLFCALDPCRVSKLILKLCLYTSRCNPLKGML